MANESKTLKTKSPLFFSGPFPDHPPSKTTTNNNTNTLAPEGNENKAIDSNHRLVKSLINHSVKKKSQLEQIQVPILSSHLHRVSLLDWSTFLFRVWRWKESLLLQKLTSLQSSLIEAHRLTAKSKTRARLYSMIGFSGSGGSGGGRSKTASVSSMATKRNGSITNGMKSSTLLSTSANKNENIKTNTTNTNTTISTATKAVTTTSPTPVTVRDNNTTIDSKVGKKSACIVSDMETRAVEKAEEQEAERVVAALEQRVVRVKKELQAYAGKLLIPSCNVC